MRFTDLVLVFGILICTCFAEALILKGTAKALGDDQVIYLEEHVIETDEKGLNKKIQTKYLKPTGQVFATMESDFTQNKLIPQIQFEDLRFSKKESLTLLGDKILFNHQKEKMNEVIKEVKFSSTTAAGQGFDNFIKTYYDQLLVGDVALSFGVLSEMDLYSFKAYKKESEKDLVRFGIALTNPLFRIFAKELVVTYDSKTKQLVTYRGLSNSLDNQQKTQNVQIDYEIFKP